MLLLADHVNQQPDIGNDMVTPVLPNWKSTLDDGSRKLLSSWVRPDPCKNWTGIGCNSAIVTSISLENLHQGILEQLNFLTLTGLKSLYIYNNRLSGFIPLKIRYNT